MGRIIVIAALVTIGVIVSAWIGSLTEKVRRRLNPPSSAPGLPAPATARNRWRDVAIGLAILLAIVVIGLLIRPPTT